MRRHAFSFFLGAALAAGTAMLFWTRVQIGDERLRAQLLAHPEFLADNPDLVAASRQVLQLRMLDVQGSERAELLQGKWAALLHVAFTPTIGPQTAARVLVEFTDYSCEPCRTSAPVLRAALQRDPDLRVALLLLPTGGALAEYAARVAFAAYKQNPLQFQQFHHGLMEGNAALTQENILAQAAAAGLDLQQIQRELGVPENRSYFEQVRQLATDLKVTGVPAFALNEQLILGGVTTESLDKMLAADRAAAGRAAAAPGGS